MLASASSRMMHPRGLGCHGKEDSHVVWEEEAQNNVHRALAWTCPRSQKGMIFGIKRCLTWTKGVTMQPTYGTPSCRRTVQ